MANSTRPRAKRTSRVGLWLFLLIIVALAVTSWVYREPVRGYANAGTTYAARIACSCRFVAGRSLEDCKKDKLAGMELITLVDNVEVKSVTARFPLITDATATHREGYGCVLEKWEG